MELTKPQRLTSLLAALTAAGLLLTGCAGGNDRNEDDKRPKAERNESSKSDKGGSEFTETEEPFEEPSDQNVFDIKIGDCITESAAEGEVESLPTVSCSQPHLYEVYHEFELTGPTKPSDTEIEKLVDEGCFGDAFTEFVGTPAEQSSLSVLYLSPTSESWAQGDHKVSCLVYEGDGTGNPTKGSLKGSGK